MTPAEVLESLAEEWRDDHVGLWRLVSAVQFDLGSTNASRTRALPLDLVRGHLHERGMQVGHPTPDGRHEMAWDLSPDQALRRREREWSALGRDPNIGERAWFTSLE